MLRLSRLRIRIKCARKEKGWSLDKLASKTNLTKSFLSETERGFKYPRLETLEKLCVVLGVKLI